jgi:hypothetical protein
MVMSENSMESDGMKKNVVKWDKRTSTRQRVMVVNGKYRKRKKIGRYLEEIM